MRTVPKGVFGLELSDLQRHGDERKETSVKKQ
jgi:hypothetical protein